MALGGKEYDIEFIPIGFNAGDLQPKKVWKDMKDEYVELLNKFTRVMNESLGSLNELWKTLHPHTDDEETQEDEAIQYGYYLHDSLNTLAFIVAQCYPEYYLSPCVIYGKEGPEFVCRIKEHPELFIRHQTKTGSK